MTTSDQNNDGGPAFPYLDTTSGGMTLRDYFAAAALTGVIAIPGSQATIEQDVKSAYQYADAMLEARKGA